MATAERVITQVNERSGEASSIDWFEALCAIDDELSSEGGQTTAVVASVDGSRVVGASVGDSSAWINLPAGLTDLTVRQRRRPLLGSGEALPVVFEGDLNGGRLLLMSDGLKAALYASVEAFCASSSAVSARVVSVIDPIPF